MEITDLLTSRPVAYRPAMARAVGGVTAGLLLAQLIYWSTRLPPERAGWLWKTVAEMEDETGLSRYEQETARKKLREIGVLAEKKAGMPARIWYRVDLQKLEKIVENHRIVESQKACPGKTPKHVRGKPANMLGVKPLLPENTIDLAEITSTTTHARADGEEGGGFFPSDLKAQTDIDDYLELGKKWGGRGGEAPSSPPAWVATVRTRLLATGLTPTDIEQLETWRRKRKKQKDSEAEKRAKEDEVARQEALSSEDARLDELYSSMSPAERQVVDDKVREIQAEIHAAPKREYELRPSPETTRGQVMREMFPAERGGQE